jgi:hypothetical protein
MAVALRRVDEAAPTGRLPQPAQDLTAGLRACRARL